MKPVRVSRGASGGDRIGDGSGGGATGSGGGGARSTLEWVEELEAQLLDTRRRAAALLREAEELEATLARVRAGSGAVDALGVMPG